MVTVENVFRDVKVSEKMIDRVMQEATDGAELLKLVYLHILNVDLDDPRLAEGEIEPWDYRIINTLANELMSHSIDALKDDAVSVNMLWLNVGPSVRKELARNTIQIKEVKH